MDSQRTLIKAAMIADGTGVHAAPGAILLEQGRIIAAGSPQHIGQIGDAVGRRGNTHGRPDTCQVIELPNAVVIPALVNAHCHLDLTHIGPVAFEGDFSHWIHMVRVRRAVSDDQIAASVRRGIDLARAGGTAAIGDIAGGGSLQPLRTLRASGLAGVSFLEVFGIGRRQAQAIAALRQAVQDCPAPHAPNRESDVAFGLQPHAPYSCGSDVYRAAAELNLPLSTHLAETLDELQFIRDANGPLADMLKRIGVWDESIAAHDKHPIDHLQEVLSRSPCIAAHLNYVEDRHIEMMASWPSTVAYCPRASAYFGHAVPKSKIQRVKVQTRHADPLDFGNLDFGLSCSHRYRYMLSAGINVALGTDSILCLNTPDRISVLDEMRLLYRRDGTDPQLLLQMATINGAIGLGIDPGLVSIKPGAAPPPIAGLLAVRINAHDSRDPLQQALLNDSASRWIYRNPNGNERE